MKKGDIIQVYHVDGVTIVNAKVKSLDPLKVEYKFDGIWWGGTNPTVVNNNKK